MKEILRRNHLGYYLLQEGIISEEQLEEALSAQQSDAEKGNKKPLGRYMIDLAFCSEQDIADAISRKADVPVISLMNKEIDMVAQNLITSEIAMKYKALPIGFEGDKLVVVMKDPLNIIQIDDLKLFTGYDIKPVVTTDGELTAALEQFANTYAQVQKEEEEEATANKFVKSSDDNFIGDEDEEMDASGSVVKMVNQIFRQALKSRASDVHLEPQEKRLLVRYRIDGVLHEIMQHPLKMRNSIISRIKVISSMDIAEKRIPQDGRTTLRMSGKIVDVRVASIPTAYGEKITLRLLMRSDSLLSLSQLGFREDVMRKFEKAFRSSHGFILITGPTGSGKSTTLYASLAILNTTEKNIITVEDPIEKPLQGLNQVQINEKANMTFASALKSILRHDPDIIMVGEIRDHETAKISVESALTGHLVLSTIHTNDSAGAVSRLTDMGVEAFLTSSALKGVLAQRLIRVLCKECKEEYEISKEEMLENVPDYPFEENQKTIKLFKPTGCVYCNNTGYKGRVGVYEFLNVSPQIQKLILAHASSQEINEVALEEGMITMRQDGYEKVAEGITSIEELLRVTS